MVFYLSSHPRNPPSWSKSDPPWRRHKYLLFILLCLVLLLIFWTISLIKDRNDSAFSRCPKPLASLQEIPAGEILSAPPVAPSLIRIKVLNSTNEFGAAKDELTRLKRLGFISNESSIGNDPIYPQGTLQCQGQIRFGENGLGSAATTRIVYPCAQLTEDSRKDNSVDIILGNEYDLIPEAKHSAVALQELAKDHTTNERLAIAQEVRCPVRLG